MKVQKQIFFGKGSEEENKNIREVPLAFKSVYLIFVILIIGVGIYFPIVYSYLIEPFIRILL